LPPLFLALVLLGANIIEKRGRKKERGGGIRAFNGRAFFFSLFFSHSNFKVPKPYLSSIPKGIFELKTTQ